MVKSQQVNKMHSKYFLFIVAIALICLFLIFFSLWREIEAPLTKDTGIPPPRAPYESQISGVGIVEASSDNITIGTPVNRIIDKVLVTVGQKVKKGDALFQLENLDLKANLMTQQTAYEIAVANLQKLQSLPRAEDLAAAKAAMKNAQVELEFVKKQYEMVQALQDSRAISQEEKNRRLFNYQQSEAKLQQVQADLEKIEAGAWKPDLEIAQLEVQQANANVNRIQAEIQRTTIQSPIDGTILQIKIHEGEMPPYDSFRTPLMVLGNTEDLFLRVSINQLLIPEFQPEAPAVAFIQGNSRFQYPLEFVRIEPLLVHKQDLTNEITERIDTRVLQIIYRIKKDVPPLFVGQQMDVFIEANEHHD